MAGATKTGSEFRVNTTTRGAQYHVDVAALAGGGFVVAFASPSIKIDDTFGAYDIYGRVYGSNYLPATPEFVIVSQTPANQIFDDFVAVAPHGTGFVAAWNSPLDDSPSSIKADTFGANGSGAGGEFEVNPGSNQFHFSDVATSTTGNYLVVWADVDQSAADTSGSAILAKLNGTGPLLTINTTTLGEQTAASVAALANGNFVVTWRHLNTTTSDIDFKAQILSAAGAKIGGEFTVAADVLVGEEVQVAATADGGFAFAYFDGYSIKGKVCNAGGTALTGNFQISDPGGVFSPAIAGLSNRLIAVVYENFADFQTMYVKTLAPDGTQIGNTFTFDANNGVQAWANYAGHPSVAALANGKFVIAWTDISGDFEIGATEPLSAIAGQIYSSTAPTFIDGNNINNAFNGVTQSGFFLGFGGVDTVSYAGAAAGVVANMTNAGGNTGAAAGDGFGISIEVLIGSGFADTLIGNALANTLTGGGGTDTLRGGLGNDIYVTDGGDIIGELANQGTDTVQSSVSLSLGSNLENLTLTGTAAINGTGNTLNNVITGNAAANVLSGGTGVDRLVGGAGNDSYITDGGDTIVEAAGQGADVVRSSVNYTLTANVETLVLTGAAGINGVGNTIANTIVGNTGANVLNGGLGNDILTGGAGSDAFLFNTALNASTNVDRITDFSVPADTIRLDNAVMAGLGTILGTLAVAKFWKSTTGLAHDADDRIVYDTDSGRLFYDANGSAAGGAVHFATVGVNLALTNADFVVI